MKICIPAQDQPTLNTLVCPHFSRAPFFAVMDSETGAVEVKANVQPPEHQEHCQSVDQLLMHEIDAIVCGGMGQRSLAQFEARGLAVFISQRARVWEVMADIRANKAERLKPEDACAGRNHPA